MPITNERFQLTALEVESHLWKRLSKFLREDIEAMRRKNDSPSLGIAETTALRGELRYANRILALADEAGQEARQAEADGPESAISRLTAD